MKKLLNALICIIFASNCLSAGDYKVIFQEGTFDEILSLAQTKNKPVMIDFNTEWCIWCRNLEMRVFTDDDFANFVNDNLINYKVDAEKGGGVELAERYTATGFPTTVFIDEQGLEIGRITGYAPAKEFLQLTKEILLEGKTLNNLKTLIDEGSQYPEVFYFYGVRLSESRDNENAKINYEKVILLDPDNSTGFATKAKFQIAMIDEDMVELQNLIDENPDNELVRDAELTFFNNSISEADGDQVNYVISRLEGKFPDDEFAKFYIGQYYLGKASSVIRDSNATNEQRIEVFEFTDKAEPYLRGMIFEAGVNYVRSELYYQLGEIEKADEYINRSLGLWSYRKLYTEQKEKITAAMSEAGR